MVNVLIELGNVYPSLTLHATFADNCHRLDNKDALEELATRTAERLNVLNMTLVNEDETVSREMMVHFAGCAQC